MRFWRSFIKEWFSFSGAERKGVWFLLVVSTCAVTIAKFYPEPPVTRADPTLVSEAKRINDLLMEDASESYYEATTTSRSPHPLSLRPFNPNDVTAEQLHSMGLPDKTVKSLLGYRSKGGVFRKADDIKKLYGLGEELSDAIIPFLIIPDSLAFKKFNPLLFSKRDSFVVSFPVEINGADSVSLLRIKGIGPVLAHKIIVYRRQLGGFYSADQLLDIYGLRAENLLLMKDQLIVDSTKIVSWPINYLSPDSMAKHPYVSKYQANAIEFYRGKVGKIQSLDELVHNRILPPTVARKLRPYIKF
ncbi:helix-hairpin-helix domain-containing protein [Williamwhitmania taraxaci]|uniref:DNA uptake protein ComE n=1 Tax=Williamwhitmania taraxaci TaxID=1640674 RepID=A0A1G6GIJ0_9BACT|nr:helix-hairpin-helix domain-containing protein [Williamwhitmania taraxaci]SDB81828.1 DNA uptake protein ComE [Williamwhitmania taraxaci]